MEDSLNRLYQEIRAEAEINSTNVEEEFIKYYANLMINNEEIYDFVECDFSGTKGNSIYRIDGFNTETADESVVLFLSHFSNSCEEKTLTNTEINRIYKKAENFVRLSFSGYIGTVSEESNVGTQLAIDLQRKKNDIVKIRVYIITDHKLSNQVKTIKKDPIDGIPVDVNIWDIQRVQSILESNMEKETVVINFEEYGLHGLECLPTSKDISKDYVAYLVVIPGDTLADLYLDYGEKLLEGNVRSFLSFRGKVNKQIRNTIINHPTLFFAYNNGIAVTAKEIETFELNDRIFIKTITDMQIINGGQTTASLAKAKLKDKADLSDINVQMKLSVVEKNVAAELIPNISRYANSQNTVREADFFSNSPFHIRFEDFSRKIPAPTIDGNQYNTYWFYERARGQYDQRLLKLTKAEERKFKLYNPKLQKITKTDLAKYQLTFLGLPYVVSSGAQKAMTQFGEYVVKKWVDDGKFFNRNYFMTAISHTICFRELEKVVMKLPWYQKGYRANIVTYVLAFIQNKIIQEQKGKALNYKRIWQTQKMYPSLLQETISVSRKMYNHLISEDRKIMNISEWAKKKECWDIAKTIKHDFSETFINDLEERSIQRDREVAAVKNQHSENKVKLEVEIIRFEEQVPNYWLSVRKWGMTKGLLSEIEREILDRLIGGISGKVSLPTERQYRRIKDLRNRLIENGMTDDIKVVI
jgi:hypothetical protein